MESENRSVAVLDEGYVRFIDKYGSDESIIEAARMSTSKGFTGWGPLECKMCQGGGYVPTDKDDNTCEKCKGTGQVPGDEKLLKYLWDNHHTTPFEMAGMTIEVQAPIFVFREWHRHRTQSYNELSARYTELPNMFYLPTLERLMAAKQGVKNKQGSADGFDPQEALEIQQQLKFWYKEARSEYEDLLNQGVAREVARLVIPVSQYSKMRAHSNLLNWLKFLTLRMDEHAQYEIRQYAGAVQLLVRDHFPRVWELAIEPMTRKHDA